MKFIYILIVLFSWSNINSLFAQNEDVLIKELKLVDARQLGLDKSTSFMLGYNQKKEKLYTETILSQYGLEGVFGSRSEDQVVKAYLIRQIFVPVGQRVSRNTEQDLTIYADSIFDLYLNQPSEAKYKSLIEKYSADKKVRWITELDETREFQTVLSALKIGEISRPFTTPKGIHIVQKLKELERVNVQVKSKFPNIESYFEQLDIKVNTAAKNKLHQPNHKKEVIIQSDYLTLYSEDFSRYALSNSARGVDLLWNDFLKYALVKDLRSRINQNKGFISQLDSLYNEELISSIYKLRVVAAAEENKDGLIEFFETKKTDYAWSKEKFVGIIVFCKNKKVLKALHEEFAKEPLNKWENIISLFNEQEPLISYEMGSFEEGTNSSVDAFVFKKGKKSKAKRKGFPKVRVYGEVQSGPKTPTEDIKLQVEADYLKFIEKNWEKDLVSKYKEGKMSPKFLKSVNNQTSN